MNNHLNFSMMKLIQALTPLLLINGALFANLEKDLQTQFILAEPGDTISIPEGHYQIQGTLSVEGKENLVIRGFGKDRSILSFLNQSEGAQGISITNSKNILLEGFTVQDSKGDAIKVQYTDLGEETLDNIQSFKEGSQFKVYQVILDYWRENQNEAQNFGLEDTKAIQQLSESKQPWSDTPAAKAALDNFRPQLEAKKIASRQEVKNVLEQLKAQIGSDPKFELISPEKQKEILKPFDDLSDKLENFHSLSTIEAQKQRVEQIIYVEQMNKLAKIKVEGKIVDPASEKISVSDKEILVEYPQQILATEEDLEAYMAAMKKAYQIVLRENKKIALS